MSVIYVVLPLAILIAAAAVVAFAWAARKGQFDDLETPAHRMLIDDDPVSGDLDSSPDPATDSALDAAAHSAPAHQTKTTHDEN